MKNKRHQVKSSMYYVFWGICTVAVVGGQLYVGTGYRMMAQSFNRIVDTIIVSVEQEYK